MPRPAFGHKIHRSDPRHRVRARKNSTGDGVGPRHRLNFIEGASVTITVADDSVNDEVDVTIASTAGGDPVIEDVDFCGRKLIEIVGAGLVGGAVLFIGTPNLTVQGTQTAFSDSTGSYRNFATGTTLNNRGGELSTGSTVGRADALWDLTFRLKTGDGSEDISPVRIFAGVTIARAGGVTTDQASVPTDFIGFKYNTTEDSDTTWHAASRGLGSATTTDTGVTVAVNTRYKLRIRQTAADNVEFYINDVLEATHAPGSNFPTAATELAPVMYIMNGSAGTSRDLRFGVIVGTHY